MKRVKMKKAFTIVEVILVLSISSLFAIGMMAGWSINIERQRYDDTVNTLKSDIQGIFNEVENPTNTSQGAVQCQDSGGFLAVGNLAATTSENRGTTNCILLGKLINFDQNRIETVDIIGSDNPLCDGITCSNHIDALNASNLSFYNGSRNNKEISIQWSNTISQESGDTPLSMIIVRSPLDNTLLAFRRSSNAVVNLGSSVNMAALRNEFLNSNMLLGDSRKIGFCVNSENNPFGGQNKLMLIGGTAASVEIAPLDGERRCS